MDDTIKFGNSIIVPHSGGYDIFLVKYDLDGNVIWARSQGSVISGWDDVGYGVAADNTGNVYLCGKLERKVSISKFDNGGNIQWIAFGDGDCETVYNNIVVNGEDNVYAIGSYWDQPITFGNITLNNSGYDDIFVVHTYTFSATVSSTTNASCHGFNNGSATVSLTGGMSPFSYLWSNNNTTTTAANLFAGVYTVTVSDVNQCTQTASATITEPPADSARICMVTVDSLSEYNIIFWDKTVFTTVDSFIVYREIATNNYQPIARLPYSAESLFIDTVNTLYFPNTGDPNAGTYRYKIQVHDTCGGYSDFSPYHNTIYFLNNNGTFYWTTSYSIENSPNPVTSYILMRDDSSNGNWHAVSSVTGSQQVVSDPLYVIYVNTASWRVKTNWGINCTPTFKNIQSYNFS
ncbi:MAG: SprB repeat-containing protein [Bacteroidetes bacterium]|nr:SprB repeat-containing protein [Bacteroidota bacterium]